MVSTFFHQVESMPATFTHIICMSLLFLYQWNYNVPASKIGVHYDRVLTDQQWWRCILAAYSHGSIMHIAFNMWGLWTYGYVEELLGSLTYLRFSFLLLIGSKALMLIGTWILFRFFHNEAQRNTYTVGYSGSVCAPDTRARVQYSLLHQH